MEAASSSSEQQLQEYESQLADVLSLLEATPEDDSLLSLKTDLEELISITRQELLLQQSTSSTLAAGTTSNAATSSTVSAAAAAAEEEEEDTTRSEALTLPNTAADGIAEQPQGSASLDESGGVGGMGDVGDGSSFPPPPKKKTKKDKSVALKEFEVPQHLIVLDTDSEAEANRKRRALKALKNKWREKKKEAESELKQKSWQSFQKKKSGSKSIFSTQDGDYTTKVGVVSMTSGRRLTSNGERKRHNNIDDTTT